jgi:hypothetical protein
LGGGRREIRDFCYQLVGFMDQDWQALGADEQILPLMGESDEWIFLFRAIAVQA